MMRLHREAVLSRAGTYYSQTQLEEWAPGATSNRVARVEQEISNPEFIVIVAELQTELIGYAIAIPAKEELRALYVKPNPVGRVGQKLLKELEKLAFKTATQLTCDASLNAVKFYQRNGYVDEGPTDHILRSGATAPCRRMKKLRPIRCHYHQPR